MGGRFHCIHVQRYRCMHVQLDNTCEYCTLHTYMYLTLGAHAQEGYGSWVCVCVCVSVCCHISPLERLFVLKILSRTQRATEVKTFVGFSLKPLRSRVMARNESERSNMLIRLDLAYSCLPAIGYSCSMYSEAPAVTA